MSPDTPSKPICPKCKAALSVTGALAIRELDCPKCGLKIAVVQLVDQVWVLEAAILSADERTFVDRTLNRQEPESIDFVEAIMILESVYGG